MVVGEKSYAVSLRRGQLIELLEGRATAQNLERYESDRTPASGELIAIWPKRPTKASWSVPGALVLADEEFEDFLAWSVTYMRGVGPLSAQVRVLSSTAYQAMQKPEAWNIRDVIAGAAAIVLAEAWVLSSTDKSPSEITPSAIRATLSFALLRAAHVGMNRGRLEEVARTFQRIRRDVQRSFPPQAVESIIRVVEGLIGAANQGASIPEASIGSEWLRLLYQGSDVYQAAHKVLARPADLLSSNDIGDLRSMTAEERVSLLDQLAPSLVHGDGPQSDRAFALAIASFVCRPGFDQQVSLLAQYAKQLPEAWLWLGALQMTVPVGDVLGAGNGSGWLVARELLRDEDLLSPPRADVSAAELTVMLRGRSAYSGRLLRRSRIEVELAPLVTVLLPGRESDDYTASESRRASSRSVEDNDALMSAEQAVEEANHALSIARTALRRALGGAEQNLSTSRSRRRR